MATLTERCKELEDEIAGLRQVKMQLSELKSAQSTLQRRLEEAEMVRDQLQTALDEKSASTDSPSLAEEQLETTRQELSELQERYDELSEEKILAVERLEDDLAAASRQADRNASELEDVRQASSKSSFYGNEQGRTHTHAYTYTRARAL